MLPQLVVSSNETLSISWHASVFTSFSPRANQTVSVRLPGEALASRQPFSVSQFQITVDPGAVSTSGTLANRVAELLIASELPLAMEIVLVGEVWRPGIGLDDDSSNDLLQGISSSMSEAGGWNQVGRCDPPERRSMQLEHTPAACIPSDAAYRTRS
jgi:hypothetical protein